MHASLGTLLLIERRTLPPLRGRAVLAGLAVAVVIALVGRSLLAPIPGLAATILGIGLGGFVAGKWADSAGLYHGALVGVGSIGLEILGAIPYVSYSTEPLADTAIVIAIDVFTMLAGAIGGWLAKPDPSSSSGTGKGR
jgi:hypothetical protein